MRNFGRSLEQLSDMSKGDSKLEEVSRYSGILATKQQPITLADKLMSDEQVGPFVLPLEGLASERASLTPAWGINII